MKPILRKVTPNPEFSFTVRRDFAEAMINSWHYHPEFEILYIKRSTGTWLIGDHIGHFETGNVILLGSNLPHCYKHEPDYLRNEEGIGGETIGILFLEQIMGRGFFDIPETAPIKQLLEKSAKGLQITGKAERKCAKIIDKMQKMTSHKRYIALLSLLNIIAERKEYQALSTGVFTSLIENDSDKIKIIFDYTMDHYDEKITIEHVASLIHMTGTSFCRFFKKKTRKTFVQFLMEVRIGKAGKLLVEEEKNVTEICYACGYNNLSHFHIHFKKITGMKPLEYKKNYISKAS